LDAVFEAGVVVLDLLDDEVGALLLLIAKESVPLLRRELFALSLPEVPPLSSVEAAAVALVSGSAFGPLAVFFVGRQVGESVSVGSSIGPSAHSEAVIVPAHVI
jgi:hypothetical protein